MQAYLERRTDLVRVFAGRLRSQARAEDLVQAMFAKLATIPEDEAIANPVAYLYRLGANLMLDDIRQDRRRRSRDRAWSDLQGVSINQMRASDTPDPYQTADGRERLRRLLVLLHTWPPQTQRVFRAHKLQHMSHAETAEALGISKSAVEKHVSMALKLLTEQIND